ncbi:HIT-type Zinc finger family protein [Wolffia australiana]
MGSKSDTILVPGSANPSSSSATRTICLVCQKQFSQYTCPRCNTRYCSLNCYQKHSIRCTESFMKENVMGEMRQMMQDSETKRKTLEMLKRVHLQEAEEELISDEAEETVLSQETIDKVLAGSDLKLEDLSVEERKLFQRAIASGALSKMIEPWEPWWLKPSAGAITLREDGSQRVRPVSGPDPVASFSGIPLGPETPLPPLSELTSRAPSPLLPVHFLEILYSYCFTLRLYNGDWGDDYLGAALVAVTMSPVLAEERDLSTVAEVLSLCLERTCSSEFKHAGGVHLGQIILNDIICLLRLGRAALICLLCDLRRLVDAAETYLKSEKVKVLKKGETRRRLKRADKKVYFLMCWINEQQFGETYSALAGQVQIEMASLTAVSVAADIPNPKEFRRGALIEEV